MREIGLFDAKTNLSKIAERVKLTGEAVTLTKRGEPYVDIVPHQAASSGKPSKAKLLADLARLRKELTKSSMEQIKADIAEGRE